MSKLKTSDKKKNKEILARIGKNAAYDLLGVAIDDDDIAYRLVRNIFYSVYANIYHAPKLISNRKQDLNCLDLDNLTIALRRYKRVNGNTQYRVNTKLNHFFILDIKALYESEEAKNSEKETEK